MSSSDEEPTEHELHECELSRDKEMLLITVRGLEDTIEMMSMKHNKYKRVIQEQAKEIEKLKKQVKGEKLRMHCDTSLFKTVFYSLQLFSVLACSLRSSTAKATLLQESVRLGRRIDKLHPPIYTSNSVVSQGSICKFALNSVGRRKALRINLLFPSCRDEEKTGAASSFGFY
jgi:predicted RNase H-like nuclease (RuvC/YqgF family)